MEYFFIFGLSYVEDMYKLCEKVLGGDYFEFDCLLVLKLMECVMMNCRGRVDVVIESYVNIVFACFVIVELLYFRDWFMMIYVYVFYYNVLFVLVVMNWIGKMNEVFVLWSNMFVECRKSGERKNFIFEYVKKVCVLGFMVFL